MKIKKIDGTCYECKKHFENGYKFCFSKKIFKNINLCGECSVILYNNLSKLFVPKSPQNVVIRGKNKTKT